MKLKSVAADLLFGAQIILAAFFCGSELLHLLQKGVDSSASVTMFLSVEAFAVINLLLAIRAHKTKPSRITMQTLLTYVAWVVFWGANVVVLLTAFVQRPGEFWGINETVAVSAVTICLGVVWIGARVRNLDFTDPIVRGCNALVFKAVPQLFQAWKFAVYGGASWAGFAIGMGHVTIWIRLGQLAFSVREAREDRNRIGSAISEIGNELSWIIATVVWLMWRF